MMWESTPFWQLHPSKELLQWTWETGQIDPWKQKIQIRSRKQRKQRNRGDKFSAFNTVESVDRSQILTSRTFCLGMLLKWTLAKIETLVQTSLFWKRPVCERIVIFRWFWFRCGNNTKFKPRRMCSPVTSFLFFGLCFFCSTPYVDDGTTNDGRGTSSTIGQINISRD